MMLQEDYEVLESFRIDVLNQTMEHALDKDVDLFNIGVETLKNITWLTNYLENGIKSKEL